jgi:hypothetical protein
MKRLIIRLFPLALAACSAASAQTWTNYIRQTQMPAGVTWDASSAVAASGTQLSALAINPGGARFDLWTILNGAPPAEYLLDTRYVSAYIPQAEVTITSEDPYAVIPRTRADRPFTVSLTVSGLLSGASDPEPSKSVSFLRHVQSYGVGGTGVGINRDQAILLEQSSIDSNGLQTIGIPINEVPGADRAKIRGEERFSVFSLEDYQAPESQLASKYIQIWPVADGSIAGITEGQVIRLECPDLTITMNDLYPKSSTSIQYYKGSKLSMSDAARNQPGFVLFLPWSLNHDAALPLNKVEILRKYDRSLDTDGTWTIELVTTTPFGVDRLHAITFVLDRTIELNGTFTTIE